MKEWKARNGKGSQPNGSAPPSTSDDLVRQYLVPMFDTLELTVDKFDTARAAQPDPKVDATHKKVPVIPKTFANYMEACKGAYSGMTKGNRISS